MTAGSQVSGHYRTDDLDPLTHLRAVQHGQRGDTSSPVWFAETAPTVKARRSNETALLHLGNGKENHHALSSQRCQAALSPA